MPKPILRRPCSAAATGLATAVLACLLTACAGTPPPAPEPGLPPTRRSFDGERALAEAQKLAALGPRPTGSEAAQQARDWLRSELTGMGLDPKQRSFVPPPTAKAEDGAPAATADGQPALVPFVHVVAVQPGASPDRLLLAATYDTLASEGEADATPQVASGAALLLELARSLAASPLPYTTEFLFMDGAVDGTRPETFLAARLLTGDMRKDGTLAATRLGVFFGQVCTPGAPFIRDMHSMPSRRDAFWRTAAHRGQRQAFPPATLPEDVAMPHLAFFSAGLPRIVALTELPAAESEGGEVPACSAARMQAVGDVVLETLADITDGMTKVDRLAAQMGSGPVPEPQPAAGSGQAQGAAPEAAPEATPETAPEAAPEPAPEATPEAAPEPAPEPDAAPQGGP